MWSVLKRCNPFRWSTRTIKIATAVFFAVALPVYLFIGLQPSDSANSANYPTLEIPKINLTTPVEPLELKNNELIAPGKIAGSYSNNSNKTLLIGHSSTVFTDLKSLSKNDQFIYDNAVYKIQKVETLAKSEISMLEILSAADTPTIVLMTCAGEKLTSTDYTHRLIITATLDQ